MSCPCFANLSERGRPVKKLDSYQIQHHWMLQIIEYLRCNCTPQEDI